MRRHPLIAPTPALALLLAACGSEKADAPGAPATPAIGTAEPQGASPPATRAEDSLAAIPARFLGIWDAETGTCHPASDLRLEIAPDGIVFYESAGEVTGVSGGAGGPVTVALAMKGEGETWTMDMTLDLTGSGADERLITRHKGALGEPLARKRCPA